ncbi:hypothetical protein NOX27_24575 [Enterobacter kobei]|uniref:hypothetical protein n=1 Tax=Enterobacter cloacae complex TaxID=354276 RepID=UPI00210A0C58|nr:hypothetical protein [Enterobacter kobei]HEP0317298.1 hypothetical protein [Enterobacter bugandensis]MCQ4359480.1 hypothetical protein [Enterobacter kobei]HDC4329832.1 hypothetical protein [Enterobacter kobei]HDC4425715.1 hypothetical protein [Enterobacter kobei]HDC4630465.1 hypothetical protein [Enterobacter kobei]
MYNKVIASLNEVKKSSKHLTDITKIVNETEDDELIKLLMPVLVALSEHSTNAPAAVKNTPRNFISGKPFDEVFKYCLPYIKAKKPEWQVLAERHGWIPPAP